MEKKSKKKKSKEDKEKKGSKAPPLFYLVNQIMDDNKVVPLFKKPIYCSLDKILGVALSKCKITGNLVTVQIKALDKEGQVKMLLESNEFELMEFTKE